MALLLKVSDYGRLIEVGMDGAASVWLGLGWNGLATWKVERGEDGCPGHWVVRTPCFGLRVWFGREVEAEA